jgi:hypothetical protein
MALACAGTPVAPVAHASPNVLCIPRSGSAGEGLVLVELDGAGADCVVPRPGVDLLTGERTPERMHLPPYGVAVLQYD